MLFTVKEIIIKYIQISWFLSFGKKQACTFWFKMLNFIMQRSMVSGNT